MTQLLFSIHLYQVVRPKDSVHPTLLHQCSFVAKHDNLLAVKEEAELFCSETTQVKVTDSIGNVYHLVPSR